MIARTRKDSARILHGSAEVDTRALPSCLPGPRVSSPHVTGILRDSTAVIGAGATMIAHDAAAGQAGSAGCGGHLVFQEPKDPAETTIMDHPCDCERGPSIGLASSSSP